MQGESTQKISKGIETWAEGLACPACHGALRFANDRIACTACGRVYPVEDGIPVLIAERATVPTK